MCYQVILGQFGVYFWIFQLSLRSLPTFHLLPYHKTYKDSLVLLHNQSRCPYFQQETAKSDQYPRSIFMRKWDRIIKNSEYWDLFPTHTTMWLLSAILNLLILEAPQFFGKQSFWGFYQSSYMCIKGSGKENYHWVCTKCLSWTMVS